MWIPFMAGARVLGCKAFEAAFVTFCRKEVVVTLGTYTVANEIYTATTGNPNLSRQAYLKGKAGVDKARATCQSVKIDAQSLEKSADVVVKMM